MYTKTAFRHALVLFFLSSQVIGQVDFLNDRPIVKHLLPYKEGRILVRMHDQENISALMETASSIGALLVQTFDIVPGLALFEYDARIDIHDAIFAFSSNNAVHYAEPDYYYYAAIQNDPRYPEQWALENTGQTGGTADADINAQSMWAIEDGDAAVVIGVIDTGVDYNHPDLNANMWRNPGEIAGNGVDDDGNGYVDDIYGINAIAHSGNPMDDHYHGTHVSGTIGADGNNNVGVVGVAQNVKIAGCKFLSSSGSGSISDAIACMQYFANLKSRAQNPVNLVATSNSWGGGSVSSAMFDAIKVHQDLGILFVAAAGNSGMNNDTTSSYPSNYDLPNVIAVAATDHNDRLASFSNYGSKTVHLGAPGVQILSTTPNASYGSLSGTSMATPHVSGLIAILKSRYPAYDYRQLKNLAMAGGTPLQTLQSVTISGRRIRGADSAGIGSLTCANQSVSSRLKPINNSVSIALGQKVLLSAQRINCQSPLGNLTVYSDANESVVLSDTGTAGDLTANDGIYTLLWQPQRSGNYNLNFGNNDTVNVAVGGGSATGYKANVVAYGYESISGTSLGATDDSLHSISIPFAIPFNNNASGYNVLYIATNGTISFTTSTNPGYSNRSLPTASVSNLVAPFWDDLTPSGTNSNIYAAVTGSAPNRHLVVEWRNLRNYNASGTVSFQAIFYENNSDIRLNYLDTDFGNASYNAGASATVGIQTSASAATQYSFNSPKVPSQTSIVFRM